MRKTIVRCLLAASIGVVVSGAGALAQGDGPMAAPAGYYTFQKVVYQNDGGLPDANAYFERLLRNVGNHIQAVGGKVEIRVVDFGEGVKPFVTARTDAALAAKIDALKAKGVRFLICHNTLEGMKLKPSDLTALPPKMSCQVAWQSLRAFKVRDLCIFIREWARIGP